MRPCFSLDTTLSMTGQHTIVAKTAKGSGQYILTLTKTGEAGAGSASFGYARRRMFLTTAAHPEAQLLAPLVDPFGNPLGGANVDWALGTACQPEGFCETGQGGAYRSSRDGWANMSVTPGSGSQTLYRPWMAHPPAVGAQGQGARRATAPAAGGDPRLGYLDMDLDAVRGGDLPSPAEAVEMERWQRFEIGQRQRSAGGSADVAHVMAMLDGPGCSGAALTCGDDAPVFEPVRVDLGSGESLQDVTLTITDGTGPVTALDGDTVTGILMTSFIKTCQSRRSAIVVRCGLELIDVETRAGVFRRGRVPRLQPVGAGRECVRRRGRGPSVSGPSP